MGWWIQLLLVKPILWKVKVPLCWRKPGIWANAVAAFLSLLLKSLPLLSFSQFNYCNFLSLTWFLALHFSPAICPDAGLSTAHWCLFGQSAKAWLSCTSPPSHLFSLAWPLRHYIFAWCRDAQYFFQCLCPHSVSWPLLCCSVIQECQDKKTGTENISFTLSLGDHLFHETHYIGLTYLFHFFDIKHIYNSVNCN